MLSDFKTLYRTLSSNRKWEAIFISFLLVMSSIAEVVSIGLIGPFLMAFTGSTGDKFGIEILNDVKVISLIFIVAAIIAAAIRLLLLRKLTRFSFEVGADISTMALKNVLLMSYSWHINNSTSRTISAIVGKINIVIYGVINNALTLVSSAFILFVIATVLFIAFPFIMICVSSAIAIAYAVLIRITKRRIQKASNAVAEETEHSLKYIQQALGGIRDIILNGNQNYFVERFARADSKLRESQGDIQYLSISPRYFVEAIGLITLVVLANVLSADGQKLEAVSVLGIIGLAAQRMLPLVQQCFTAFTTIKGCEKAFEDTLSLLNLNTSTTNYDSWPQNLVNSVKQIEINKLSFSYYRNDKTLFDNISLTINSGDMLGLRGQSGAGKSTLVDIILGLLTPTGGDINFICGNERIKNDTSAAHNLISHVPQEIFICEGSIAENIAFGERNDSINYSMLKLAVEISCLDSTIYELPNGINTIVGERGQGLSGGQRQRIGIARAIYMNKPILILDEATSALDNSTEISVMNNIAKLYKNRIVIVVAHRKSSFEFCNMFFDL